MFHRVSLVAAVATLLIALAASVVSAAPATSHSGQATLVKASVLGITTAIGDTGPLPSSGGKRTSAVTVVNLPDLLTAGVGQASTQGQGNQSRSQASLTDLALTVLGISISATAVRSEAEARCQAGQPEVSGGSEVAGLVVNGVPIGVAAPNLTVSLPGVGTVVVNEQRFSTSGDTGESTVNALHVTVPVLGLDLVVASSQADITCDQGQPGQ